MTETASEIERFYGAAIVVLRWWVKRWSVPRLARESGVSATSILSIERGKTVPRPETRKKLARALGFSLGGLDRLAAALQKELGRQPSSGIERIVAEIAAGLAADFHRAAVPWVERLVSAQTVEPPAASDEDVYALAPVLPSLDAQSLQALLDQAPSLYRWAFVKGVGEESAQAASVDAQRALELASFALRVAERVSGEEQWPSLVFGWAYLGNARRVSSDLAGSEEAYARSALLQQEQPDGVLPERWRLLDLEASLRIDLLQLPEALRLLDQAALVAPKAGSIQAHLLCIRSIALERMGQSEASIASLREALSQIYHEAEPRLCCMLLFNLAERLTSIGKAAEAADMLPELRRLQPHVGNGLNQLRLRWLEGKIDAGLGRLDRAIETLSWVRAAFAEKDIRYDEAQAGMELAGLYLEKGRTADVKRLVLEMEPVFRAKGIHQEAQKALLLFRRAVEMETVTIELVRRIAAYLRCAQGDPRLRFAETL
jgi:transcriptional regulator with XRE-family HTH domain